MDQLTLIKLATAELYKIKHHATEEEFKLLIEGQDGLDGEWPTKCIYGTMTGSCYSARAEDLIKSCAGPTYFTEINPLVLQHATTAAWKSTLIGRSWTALEVALFRYPQVIKDLVSELEVPPS